MEDLGFEDKNSNFKNTLQFLKFSKSVENDFCFQIFT